MDGVERATGAPVERDGRGRFVPGQSGNPAGKAPGTRNGATRLRELLEDGEDAKAARVVIDRALEGNLAAARFLVDRLFPKARGREIDLGIAPPEQGGSLEAMLDAALWRMAAGDITPDEASLIARLIHDRRARMNAASRADVMADVMVLPGAAADAAPPAFDLQTAGPAPVPMPAAAAAAAPPLNRHQRRVRAALLRSAGGQYAPPAPPLAASAPGP